MGTMLFFGPDPPAEARQPAHLTGNCQKLAEDMAICTEIGKTCCRLRLLRGNPGKLAEGDSFCNEIPENLQKTTTSARKSEQTCRRLWLLQETLKKLAEGDPFCKGIPKNLQRS